MKKSLKIIGLFYLIVALCNWGNIFFHVFPKDIFSFLSFGVFLGGSLIYIIVRYRTRLLGFAKKLKPLGELNFMASPHTPTNKVISGSSWFALIIVTEIAMVVLGTVFYITRIENALPKPFFIFLFIVIGLYGIPVFLFWFYTQLFHLKKIPVIANDQITQSKQEKYMLVLVGGIIRIPLIVQTILHSSAFCRVLMDFEATRPFLYCAKYILIYSLFSSVLIFFIYNKIDRNQIKKLIRLSLMMYCFMLPAVYLISMILNDSYFSDILYVWNGIILTTILILINAVTFFALLSIWYIAKKILRKSIKDTKF